MKKQLKSAGVAWKSAYAENPSSFFWFLFLLVIILTLTPFFRIGFTTADDLEYYMSSRQGHVFMDAFAYAKATGRFYFLFMKPLYHIPYLVDNFYFTKIIQYGFLLLSFVLFAFFIWKIFKKKEFALLIFLLLFSFLSVTPNYHIPIIAYPFYFTASFSIFLGALLFLIKYFETSKNKYLTLSVVLSAIALLFYENYLIFLLFIVAFLFFRNLLIAGKQVFKKRSFYKELLPFCLVGIVYVIIYALYRESVQTEKGLYDGAVFAKNFSFPNFFDILWNYNRSAIPINPYQASLRAIGETIPLVGGHRNNFFYILANAPISVFANTLIQCFLFIFLLRRIKSGIPWKTIRIAALIALLLTFSVHILIAVSEKYNTTDWHRARGYVTTFYSYFCMTLLLSIFIYSCFKAGYRIKWLRYTIVGIFTLALFYVAIVTGYSNEYLSRNWDRSQNRFTVMDCVLEKGIFDNVADDAIIYSGDMLETTSHFGKGVCKQGFTWKRYVAVKIGRELNMFDNLEAFTKAAQGGSGKDIYILNKWETPKSNDMLLVLTKINPASINAETGKELFLTATSNEASVYYYSPNDTFRFEFLISDSSAHQEVFVNGEPVNYSIQGINVLDIDNRKKKEPLTSFLLQSEAPFHARSFMVSNIGFVSR